jgi:hypothetical protein
VFELISFLDVASWRRLAPDSRQARQEVLWLRFSGKPAGYAAFLGKDSLCCISRKILLSLFRLRNGDFIFAAP